MKRLTRPAIKVDETVTKYLGTEIRLESINDRLLELILNGPTLMAVKKDVLRQLIRQMYSALQAYEDIGLEAEKIIDVLAKATVATMFGAEAEKALDNLMDYQKAEQEGRLVNVVHGRWIPGNGAAQCSECDAFIHMRYKYCPNCGARMDKEKEPEG